MLWFAPTMSVDTEATACAARSGCACRYARVPLISGTHRNRTVRFGLGSTPALMIAIHARPASSCVAGPPQLSLAPCFAMPSKRCAVKWNSSFVDPSPGIVATTTCIGVSYSVAFTIAWTLTCWCFSTRDSRSRPIRSDRMKPHVVFGAARRTWRAPHLARRRCRSSRSDPADRSACRCALKKLTTPSAPNWRDREIVRRADRARSTRTILPFTSLPL